MSLNDNQAAAQASPSAGSRRKSFLEIGGANSIQNFASSFARAQSYSGLSFLEGGDKTIDENLSPLASPSGDQSASCAIVDEPPRDSIGQMHLFNFPHDENSPLLSATPARRVSKVSVFSGLLITGDSTGPQTIFNAINTLLGIAMLSLPFGFKLTGWVVGTMMLLFTATVTNITAKMLGKILRKNPNVTSYGDIAQLVGGSRIQLVVTAIFTVDLLGATISLILLFSDSFHLLFPEVPLNTFKLIIVLILYFTSFLPLSILSFFSIFGILCTSVLIVTIITCGFLTENVPGSLINPAQTSLWPQGVNEVILSIGIFMAPWGGHPVFPELYRDMRHPSKYSYCCNIAFSIVFKLNYIISVIGYLMIGVDCQDSIIKNLMVNEYYPEYTGLLICIIMGLLPISKLPLVVKPLITVYEKFLNINNVQRVDANGEAYVTYKNGKEIVPFNYKKFFVRLIFISIIYFTSTLITNFGKVIAFLGSAICFTICLTLPLVFYIRLFYSEIPWFKNILIRLGIVVGILGAVVGTYGSIAIDVK